MRATIYGEGGSGVDNSGLITNSTGGQGDLAGMDPEVVRPGERLSQKDIAPLFWLAAIRMVIWVR
jgi:hypothetical protein